MSYRHIVIPSRSELYCPICHMEDECKTHCVEVWKGEQRIDHLTIIIEQNQGMITPAFREKFTHIENCFEGFYRVSWYEDAQLKHLPLFSGKILDTPSTSEQWHALFHPRGIQLLEVYNELIVAQIRKPDQIRKILRAMRQTPQNVRHDSGGFQQLSLFSMDDIAQFQTENKMTEQAMMEEVTSLCDAIEPEKLMEEILKNLT
ncbi:MAG: hypothetical protein HQM12_11455 [SAR324 cluster bacterium]|nr:hypothetical protein [SAR324 cluster bacterium]